MTARMLAIFLAGGCIALFGQWLACVSEIADLNEKLEHCQQMRIAEALASNQAARDAIAKELRGRSHAVEESDDDFLDQFVPDWLLQAIGKHSTGAADADRASGQGERGDH